MVLPRKGFTLILSGPSGAGKSSICRALLARDSNLGLCVTTTTRPRRADEVEGRDRFFLSEKEFRDGIRRGIFAEWAEVHGFLYGTTWESLRSQQEAHDVVILDVDVQGAAEWKSRLKDDCVSVFVAPPSMEALKQRLNDRGTDAEADLGKRLENARKEMTHFKAYDYLIVNDRIEAAVECMEAILVSERGRSFRYEGNLLEQLK